jgi:UDP-N-acetylglucosamine 2-epimerase (non-hydrolysing)
MYKVAILAGTRPEAIKMIPVYLAFKNTSFFHPILVSTGQHKEMLEQIFNFFHVKPDIELNVMTANQSLNELTSLLFQKIGSSLKEIQPDILLVQGDTTSAMVGALAAFYEKVAVGHIEAGLRTYNKYSPYPEEVNRQLISRVADLHFAPTTSAAEALKKEGIRGIRLTGNTVVDSLMHCIGKVKMEENKYIEKFASFIQEGKKLVLVTGHRRESFGEGFQEICLAIQKLALANPDFNFVYPVHLNPNVRKPVFESLDEIQNVFLIDPVPYDEMVFLMNAAFIILTDSGGIQEEAPSLGKPLIVMRDTTERPEGVSAGCAVLAGNKADSIIHHFNKISGDLNLYQKMSAVDNPYGDGKASEKIVQFVKDFLDEAT